MSTLTPGRGSISSVTGEATAKAVRTGSSSRPSSPSRRPSVLAWMPMRWRADTALGEAYDTRADPSSTRHPSPTLRFSSVSPSSRA